MTQATICEGWQPLHRVSSPFASGVNVSNIRSSSLTNRQPNKKNVQVDFWAKSVIQTKMISVERRTM